MDTVENGLIQIQVNKEVTSLYKDFLEIIEDIKIDHEIMAQKIIQKNGQSFYNDINYFTLQKYNQIRKRVLDKGNDNLRQLLFFLSFFDFTINKQKIEEALKQKYIVTKKFITSGPITVE